MKMKKILSEICLTAVAIALNFVPAFAQVIDLRPSGDISPYLFGYNLEHTRSAVHKGLSAQMLENRKFAGKPSQNEGVALGWFGIGEDTYFMTDMNRPFTRHIGNPDMWRRNELYAQTVHNLAEGQQAGIGQYGLTLEEGRTYQLRTVTRADVPMTLTVTLSDRYRTKVYARRELSLEASDEWAVSEFSLTPSASDADACITYTFTRKGVLVIGALSMMPEDNFHGMRRDVVENFKAIGPRLLRWPGGNFAGEYRWKDGLLPVDERGPLQAATEIETQPHSYGYDFHEINTDDFMALCREVGAEPMITLNLAWSSPEESAQWVEYCNGGADTEYGRIRARNGHPEPYNVHFWSLGNEMGYGHMEGPKGPEGYAAMAAAHVRAMLEVSPYLEFVSSGPYPNDDWAKYSAAALSDTVRTISLHHYAGGGRDFTTEERARESYESIVASFGGNVSLARDMRKSLDATGKKLLISFDEWNQWYAWFRPSFVADGIYAAKVMHFYITESEALGMPMACYFQPIREGAVEIMPTGSRLTANGQIFALLKAHQGGKLCRVEDNEGYPVLASMNGKVLTITLINESYDENRSFIFPIGGKKSVIEAVLLYSDKVGPHSYFSESTLPVKTDRRRVETSLPPHSVAKIVLQL